MAEFTCGVCGRENLLESERKILKLTQEEQDFAYINTGGQNPSKDFVYCKPCYRLLQNPLAGAELMRGTLLANLRASGVPDPERVADAYYKWLLTRASPEPLS